MSSPTPSDSEPQTPKNLRKKSTAPITPIKDAAAYSSNPVTVAKRQARQQLEGYELELSRAQVSDAKAKSDLKKKLLAESVEYQNANNSDKEAILMAEWELKLEQRFREGRSGNVWR